VLATHMWDRPGVNVVRPGHDLRPTLEDALPVAEIVFPGTETGRGSPPSSHM
jgi:hypothetical protein